MQNIKILLNMDHLGLLTLILRSGARLLEHHFAYCLFITNLVSLLLTELV
jgi:hypothetical protein